ncbi:formate dehydrogenase accessory sulfurtransferase FdhD [Paracoccus caeni]|uniref:Sulfur carrier protein FdhD n=1 Tax=Paracoccus caeni TaxID=657651 RepID=A0A934SP18_9RHOB|nr:formate dehydrogenase accessory sulfurtransferase FdhD [Paracoccus caeni]MBK4217828.1 formate dehydrogenase accessory sulfurtransferase FdhD [Paracoccus caeni]
MHLPKPLGSVRADHHRSNRALAVARVLPEETAIAMVYNGTTHAVMMATPADIEDFAIGFSLTEGIVTDLSQITSTEVELHPKGIEARLWLTDERADALAHRRRTLAGPVGCGLCGIDSLEEAMRPLPDLTGVGPILTVDEISQATDALRKWQPLHDRSKAVHAAGFLLPGQGIVMAREDVGRHNALDKLIGAMARAGVDPSQGAFVLTSRVSTEMVQKTAMAGCGIIIAVSAPTLHALRLAKDAGITLAAFARGEGFDLFSHTAKLDGKVPHVA